MDAIKTTAVPSMRLSRAPTSSSPSPLHQPPGSLHLTTHHLIFERGPAIATAKASGADLPGWKQGEKSGEGSEDDNEIWIPLSLLHSVTRTPPDLTGAPTPLILRTRLFETYYLSFSSTSEADAVWDSLKGLCGSFSSGGVEQRWPFFLSNGGKSEKDRKGKGRAGWEIYDPKEEFARMGLGTRSNAWRFTTINADFEFCPSYPAEIVVPAKISDTTLSYAVKYRSKSRIPGLVYLHWANLGSITRSSQPMVGITQSARSVQDEKLIEAIFNSHSQHSHSFQPMTVSDRPVSPLSSYDPSSSGQVYGATASNIIIDARPTKNAYANSVKGAGTENMLYYKNCRKEYLGIDNIHVMRSSLNGVFDALGEAETTGHLDRSALRRTGWLSHLTNILDGVLIIVKTVHLHNSHALVHCSDGWDRTSQLSALPQLCLDPFFRTARGLTVLIEKDWISYGHRFSDRSGNLCDDRVNFTQKLGDDATAQQAFLASVQKQFAPSSHAFRETCPVFQQFLDCIYQLQRQFPDRFEYNEQLLQHLVRETYGGSSGTFLLNSEKDRREKRARERTTSVWETVFDFDDSANPSSTSSTSSSPSSPGAAGNLSLKPTFRNPSYNPELDNPASKAPDADQGVLMFNPQDVKWWFELFGRTEEEMNGLPGAGEGADGALPSEPTRTEHKVVEGEADDPVLHPITARTADLSLSSSSPSPSPATDPLFSRFPTASSPSHFSAPLPPHPSASRSPSPSSSLSPPANLNLNETVASVRSFGWSAFKSVQKFGAEAAKQLREAQERREHEREAEVRAQEEAQRTMQQHLGRDMEGSTGSWRAEGSEGGGGEMRDGAGWGLPTVGGAGGGSVGSLGRSAGAMWSKFSASNPWAAGGESNGNGNGPSSAFSSSSSSSANTTPATSTPTYATYQARSSRPSAPSYPSSFSSPSASSSSPSRPPASAARQPSSTLSINPWETISPEEASPPSPLHPLASSAAVPAGPPPASAPLSSAVAKDANEGRGSVPLGVDPLGVGMA
ncbi:hypothetical protein JCM8547_001769 [Rhodosporidiobolus lusitaniae]